MMIYSMVLATIILTSDGAFYTSYHSWNPILAFIMGFAAYGFYFLSTQQQDKLLIFSGLAAGLACHGPISFILLFLQLFLLFAIKYKKFPLKLVFGFSIAYLPYVIYELFTGLSNSRYIFGLLIEALTNTGHFVKISKSY
ncbi:MAG: hypothetical protein HN576_14805 [Bacteriovoracaceae bacterium]|nr:hypothetical protein [Bacteriovoracaceae bacterium]